MLRCLVDTSTWLDLAKRRDGRKWIVAIRVLVHHGKLELLVPTVIIEEFERNRGRIEESMTAGIQGRFRQLREDLGTYGGEDQDSALQFLDLLSHQVPLIGAMTTRNFNDIAALLLRAPAVEPGDAERHRVIERGLRKLAPFHLNKNQVADALLLEL